MRKVLAISRQGFLRLHTSQLAVTFPFSAKRFRYSFPSLAFSE